MRFPTVLLCIATLSACNIEGHDNTKNVPHKESSVPVSNNPTKSIPREASKWIGNTAVKINYHSPAVRGRVIWGGLVPFDSVWVTGAHQATSIEIGKDFLIGNASVPAGKYALFTIPGKKSWTIIINKNWKQHLTDDYQQTEDVARVQAKPEITGLTERLIYDIDQTGERTANIVISWEKIRVHVPLTIK